MGFSNLEKLSILHVLFDHQSDMFFLDILLKRGFVGEDVVQELLLVDGMNVDLPSRTFLPDMFIRQMS